MGLQPNCEPTSKRILTLDPTVPMRTARRIVEFIVLRQTCSERLCRPIQFLRIKRFSLLPNAQCDCGNLARQSQPRHFGAHAFMFETPQIGAVWFRLTATRGCSDKHIF